MDKLKLDPPSPAVTVRRMAKRAAYDAETVHAILDAGLVAHVALVHAGQPFAIPMAYARVDRELVLHGAAASRLLATGAGGSPIAVCVTLLDGLVYAKSAFHHSVNYRSVVVIGRARELTDDADKLRVLDALVERVAPGRSRECRPPNRKELDATRVIALPLDEASAKIRTGPPVDDDADLALPVWTGVLPLALTALPLVALDGEGREPPRRPAGVA